MFKSLDPFYSTAFIKTRKWPDFLPPPLKLKIAKRSSLIIYHYKKELYTESSVGHRPKDHVMVFHRLPK